MTADFGYITVRYGGDMADIQAMLNSFPGDHRPDEHEPGVYCIASTDIGFLEFAWTNQGYGEVIDVRHCGGAVR
jgi:hypothetical protein